MAHRKIRDVMTTDVATVTADAPFKEMVRVMAERRVSALPVLDAKGHVAGVVSEVDLLRKEEYQEEPAAVRPPHWRRGDGRSRAKGCTARDVMTSPAVTVAPDATVVEAARLLDRHRVRRLVVIDADGRLAGIVTPGDLLRVFLRSDDEIRDEILREVFIGYLGTNPALVQVTVAGGVVTLGGEVEHKSMVPVAVRMTHAVDGVVDVVDQLAFVIDDTHLPTAADMSDH
jgi:CBS domain-containing protein